MCHLMRKNSATSSPLAGQHPSRDAGNACLGDGQITQIICIHLIDLLYDLSFRGGGGTLWLSCSFPPLVLSCNNICLDIPCAILTRNVQKYQKTLHQKKPDVPNFSARNSGVRIGCTNFMSAWHFLVFLCWKTAP